MTPTDTPWLSPDQQRSWRALVVGTTLLMDRLDDDLQAAFDISLTEYEILVRLSEAPDRSLRMAQLADSLRHSRSRVTHTVARMENAGLLRRARSDTDRRGVIATMTQEGFEVLEKAAPLHVVGVRECLVDLVPADDFDALGRVMNAVCDNLIALRPAMEIREG